MNIFVISVLSFLLVITLIAYYINMYNGLVGLKHQVEKYWKNIDVILKQRVDELTKLIKVVKDHIAYEKDLLHSLTAARTAYMNATSEEEKKAAHGLMKSAYKSLIAVAENYPDLKASQSFIQLSRRISTLEDQISDRRELYNESINLFNTRLEQFPHSMVAGILGYSQKEYFQVSESDKQDVEIDLY